PYTTLYKTLETGGYEQGQALWLKKVELHKDNPIVLGNAANYFFIDDKELAEELLKKAQALEPNNAKWSEKLSHLYSLSTIRRQPIEAAKEVAASSLSELENALSLTNSDEKRFYLLISAPRIAFKAGDMEKARRFSLELLTEAQRYKEGYGDGDAIHQANTVLGLVALRLKDLEKAKAHLLKSAETSGSPVLGSFGPNMLLAKELLELGEKEIVLKYFKLCAQFWQSHDQELKTWENDVKENRMPDFGPNLHD
ncbi:MAG: hypothetical protein AB1489_42505, partial [Acidobacteriota bacterium]